MTISSDALLTLEAESHSLLRQKDYSRSEIFPLIDTGEVPGGDIGAFKTSAQISEIHVDWHWSEKEQILKNIMLRSDLYFLIENREAKISIIYSGVSMLVFTS